MKLENWNEKKFGKFTEHNLKRSLEKQGLTANAVTYNKDVKLTKHKFSKETKIGVSVGKYEVTHQGNTYIIKPGKNLLKIPNNVR